MQQAIESNQSVGAKASGSRRRFLQATAGAASFPFLRGALGRAADAAAPVAAGPFDRKIKLGVIGCGGRGLWIARLFKQHGGYAMHAVADYFPEVTNRAGDELGVDAARRFSGLSGSRRLLGSGVEAVALETPPYFFPEHAAAAVDAGMHVYMAKPVAVDVPGCLAIESAAGKATSGRRCFLVDYQIPTDPHNAEIVARVRAGAVGKVITLNSHYYAGQFSDPPLTATIESRLQSLVWVNDVPIGGSYHVNACIHAIDAALWVAGSRPIRAYGCSRAARPHPQGDSHDVYSVLFEFADGLFLNHRGKHLNNQTGFDVACEIQAETGYAEIRYGGRVFLKGHDDGYSGEVVDPYEAGAVRNIAAFYTQVTEGQFENGTVRRSVDGALATILGREAARRRTRLTMEELLRAPERLEVNLRGLRS